MTTYSCRIIFERDEPYQLVNIPAGTESQAAGICLTWAREAGRRGWIRKIECKPEF